MMTYFKLKVVSNTHSWNVKKQQIPILVKQMQCIRFYK